jgi:HSP20 family protein
MLPTITRRSFRPFYMPNIFDEDLFTGLSNRTASMPAVNIKEDEKKYSLELAIPGINKNDLKIDMKEDVITISSEMKKESEENSDGYKRKEFSYSAFSRSFYVPENVNKEKIEASYKDGVLYVTLPKEDEQKSKISKTIEIS